MKMPPSEFGFNAGASETELYATTAACLDRIRDEVVDGELKSTPIRAICFMACDKDGMYMLYQCGTMDDLIAMMGMAVKTATQVINGEEPEYDEEP